MSRREKIIAVIMAAIILFWAYRFFPQKGRKVRPQARKNPPSATTAKAAPRQKETMEKTGDALFSDLDDIMASAQAVKDENSDTPIRDPFKKVVLKSDNPSLTYEDLSLTGIMWEEKNPVAVINDQICQKGDTVLGFQVVAITPSEVVLMKGSEKHVLKLFSEAKEE